jgi:hypothetical protein
MKCGCEVDSLWPPWSFSGKMWRGALQAALQLLLADAVLDPVERVDGLQAPGAVGLVAGLLRDALDRLARGRIVGEVVLGFLQVVVAAVAGGHHHLRIHLVRRDRHHPRGQVGLHFRVDVLHLHRPAAVPVLDLLEREAERLADRLGRGVVGVAGALQRAAGVIRDFFVFTQGTRPFYVSGFVRLHTR